jgi:glycerophosphoryl diester phosphodiesterase
MHGTSPAGRSPAGTGSPGSSEHALVTAERSYAGQVPSVRPLVVAHRGSSSVEAEHTLAAYERAIAEGADGLECDVRMTRDGHLVCVHDRRIDRVSDGRGVLSTLDMSMLQGLDFGSWHPALPDTADDLVRDRDIDIDARQPRSTVLDFATLLELVESCDRPMRMFVETKHPTRYAGLVEQTLVDQLRYFGFDRPRDPDEAPVTMMSFSTVAVRRVRELAPAVPTVLLLDTLLGVPRRDGSLPWGATMAGPGLRVVQAHPKYVRRVRERGNKVYVWVVDRPEDVEYVLALNVDGIITNRPADVLRRLRR